jgi:hypothetical protein
MTQEVLVPEGTELDETDIAALTEIFDLLARFDYEDSKRITAPQAESSDTAPIAHRTDTQQ